MSKRPDASKFVSRLNILRDKEAKEAKRKDKHHNSANFFRASLARNAGTGFFGLVGRTLCLYRYGDQDSRRARIRGELLASFTVRDICRPDETERQLYRITGSLRQEEGDSPREHEVQLEMLCLQHEIERLAHLAAERTFPWYYCKDPEGDTFPAGEVRILSHALAVLETSDPLLLRALKGFATAWLRILPQLAIRDAGRETAEKAVSEAKLKLNAEETAAAEAERAVDTFRESIDAKQKELATLAGKISSLQAQIDRTTGPGTHAARMELQRSRWKLIETRNALQAEIKAAPEKIATLASVLETRSSLDGLNTVLAQRITLAEQAVQHVRDYCF